MSEGKCDVCERIIKRDNHHIWSRSLGGPEIQWNICKLCPNCHRKVHIGKLILEGWWATTKGRILIYRKKGEKSITGIKDYPVWIYPQYEKGIKNPHNSFFKNIIGNLEIKAQELNFSYKKKRSKLKVNKNNNYCNVSIIIFDKFSSKRLHYYRHMKKLLSVYDYKIKSSFKKNKKIFPKLLVKKFKKENFKIKIRIVYGKKIKFKFILKEII